MSRWKICICVFICLLCVYGCTKSNEAGFPAEGETPSPTQGGLQQGDDNEEEPVVFTDKILYWAVADMMRIDDNTLRQYNKMLMEDGCDFNVMFVSLDTFGYQTAIQNYSEGNPVDIAYTGMEMADASSSSMGLILDGYFEPLDAYVDSSPVKALFADQLWEARRVNGQLFCVPSMFAIDRTSQYIFNMEYFSEEEVDNIELSLAALEPYLERVAVEGDFSPLIYKDMEHHSIAGKQGYFLSFLTMDMTTGRIENPLVSTRLTEHMDILHDYYQKGYMNYSVDINKNEHPLVNEFLEKFLEENANRPSSVELLKEGNFAVCIDYGCLTEEDFTYPVRVRSLPGRVTITTANQMGIVADSQYKDEAWRLLELYYTEPKYQKLLVMKDSSFTYEEEQREDLLSEYYFDCLVAGTDCELRGSWEERKAVYEIGYDQSEYASFYFDAREYGHIYSELSGLWPFAKDIWVAEDYEEKRVLWQEQFKELGVEEIVAEANAQLQEHLEESRNE